MNPIFNQLGGPNPFSGMGMNPMQPNPGMNPNMMMGGGNPGMMNPMMGAGGGMPPNNNMMMGGGGGGGVNPNFQGNPPVNNPNFMMGQPQGQPQTPQNQQGGGFGMVPAAPQPASSQGQNPFDLF